MACKYLNDTTVIIAGGAEVGGPITPQGMSLPVCQLGRRPDIRGWAKKCDETLPVGPCWFWVEERGDMADAAFQK